jgi:hypothetical protein
MSAQQGHPCGKRAHVAAEFYAGRRVLIFVLNIACAAINFHALDKRVVNGDNLSGDGAAFGIDVPNF